MAFCLLAVGVPTGTLHAVDHTLFSYLRPAASGPVGLFLELVGVLGAVEVTVPAVGVACLLVRGERRMTDPAVWAPLAVMGALLLAEVACKHLVHQVPPLPGRHAEFALLGLRTPFTYPSGHMIRATVVLGVIGTRPGEVATRRRRWVLSGCFLVLLGVARVTVGGHWPSDVVGGVLLGAAGGGAIGGR